jgi:succinyl-diaminopimelate desuccinylase
MHRVIGELLKLKEEIERRTTHYRIAPDRAKSSILMIGGQSGGGANFNVVPEESWFTVDRRINPEEDLEKEKSRLLEIFERLRKDGIPLEVEIFQEAPSSGCDEAAPLGLALAESAAAVTGEKPRFELCPGLLEIRFYADRMPAYAYGPGLLSVAHGPNEYVDLRKVAECAAVYALTAASLLHS